jgi:hypothetical protein
MRLTRRTAIPIWRVAYWAAVLTAALIALLDWRPVTLSADEQHQEAAIPQVDGKGDVAIVIDSEAMREAAARGQFERSWSWVDAVEQEVGPHRIFEASTFGPGTFEGVSFLIVTKSANAGAYLPRQLAAIEAFVSRGGVALLELPTGALRQAFAADGAGGWRTPASITAVDRVTPELALSLLKMPLFTRFMGSTRPPPDSVNFIAMDGSPVVYGVRRGEGAIVVVDFDFGAQVSALQQGIAAPGGEVLPRLPGASPRTSDLIASPVLSTAQVPYADLLEGYMIHVVLGFSEPVIGLWPYPGSARGALLSSHDAESYAGRPLWMSAHELSRSARTTTFMAVPATEEVVPRAVEGDEETARQAALLWVTDPASVAAHRRYGFVGIEPVQRRLSMAEQAKLLERALPDDVPVRGVRAQRGLWTEDAFEAWRIMAAGGFKYSVSYEPIPGIGPGFAFGTCQPFTPVDAQGFPFPLREVPVCVANASGPRAREDLDKLIQAAADGGWALHLLTSSDRFEAAADLGWFEAWQRSLDQARRRRMWVGGAAELVTFWKRRADTTLHTAQRRVTARRPDGTPTEISYVFEARTSEAGHAMVFPTWLDGMTLVAARRAASLDGGDDRISNDVERVQHVGREVAMLALQPGYTTVVARYRR